MISGQTIGGVKLKETNDGWYLHVEIHGRKHPSILLSTKCFPLNISDANGKILSRFREKTLLMVAARLGGSEHLRRFHDEVKQLKIAFSSHLS